LFDQLKYEEMLLRHSKENWCLVSSGPHRPHIVLGLSGKVDKLVHVPRVARDDIPMIRRFSGGGTVIVDSSTVFVTFIVNAKDAQTAPYPRDIMRWTEGVYGPVFRDLQADSEFRLRENDYVFGDRKIGGNAQAIIKDRWLHHTSFLWDYNPGVMGLLRLPERRPDYRKDRPHSEFLCKLRDSVATPGVLEDAFVDCAEEAFHATFVPPEDLAAWVAACGHSPVTTVLSPPPAPPP